MTRAVVATLVVACIALACGDEPPPAPAPPADVSIELPSQLLGLDVVREDVGAALDDVDAAYLESVGLFSFRESDDLLRATLQIGRFADVAPAGEQDFRDAIVGQLGATVPRELRVGSTPVYLAAGNEQSVYSWFTDDAFLVLSVRRDYPFGRTLLRRLLDPGTLA